jgi:three-Cys-motif partner protein
LVDTSKLKIVLIEQDSKCYELLKKVIARRWPTVPISEAEGSFGVNSSNIYLLNKGLKEAIAALENIELGNAIYYFDPLRYVEWNTIEEVARKRIKTFCETGTEFLIFLFTSDWFLGRDTLAPLPATTNESEWGKSQESAVLEADTLFGSKIWRKYVLNSEPIESRQKAFVGFYRFRLHRWFRYVLPLPFTPKEKQLFHLILCSNYEAGVKVTKDFYDSMTGNPPYLPGLTPSQQAYLCFQKNHPELTANTGRKRPLEWRILWRIIKYHEEGFCDYLCRDFQVFGSDITETKSAIQWLYSKNYLQLLPPITAWGKLVETYRLNWRTIKKALNIDPPLELKPISAEEFVKIQWQKLFDALELGR